MSVNYIHKLQTITIENGGKTTNNVSKSKHRSWKHVGATKLSLDETVKFNLKESLLQDAQLKGLNTFLVIFFSLF